MGEKKKKRKKSREESEWLHRHTDGDAELPRRLPQGYFSQIREVCSLILNTENPKRPAHVPTLLPGSPSSGRGGAAQGALGSWHRFRESQSRDPNGLQRCRCSRPSPAPRPASLSCSSYPEPCQGQGSEEHEASRPLPPARRDQRGVTHAKSRDETEKREQGPPPNPSSGLSQPPAPGQRHWDTGD